MAERTYTSTRPQGQGPDPNPLEGVSFTLDGVTFTCQGTVHLLDQSDLALLAAQGQGDMRSPEAQAAVAAYLRVAFGLGEYMRLKAHVTEHGTPDEVVLEIMGGIIEDVEANIARVTGRPTAPPSPSSNGRQDQGGRVSRVISLAGGDVTVVPPTPAGPAAPGRQPAGKAKRAGGNQSGNPAKRAAAGGG